MEMLDTLKEYYSNYDEEAKRIAAEAAGKPGFFGMSRDPKNDQAHVRFYESIGQLVDYFLAVGQEPGDIVEAARFLLGAAAERREMDSFWFTYAAQSHVSAMIPHMSAADCRELADWYDTRYTKLERMPAQRQVYKQLRRAAK